MGLLSNLTGRREGEAAPAATTVPVDTVQAARTKARHRLIGAVVLLLAGIVGFPLVFETQPRPTPVDVSIEIPRKENAPPLVVPAPRSASPQAAAVTTAAGSSVPPAAAASQVNASKESTAPSGALPPVETRPQATAASPARPAVPAAERAAQAPAAAAPAAGPQDAGGARYVVQVGAFADAAAVQAMRSRCEKLGLKTYTQATDTATGSRVRVRIGPFATREAAEQALAKAKAGGVSAVVLTL